jgi:hypothetical protein
VAYTIQGGKLKSRRVKSKKFTMAREQIPEMLDCVFFGNPEKPGWVEMYVNTKGREAVNSLFPKAVIRWRPMNDPDAVHDWTTLPAGWREWDTFEINLPSVAEHAPNNLSRCNGDQPLSEANQTQLAFVLALSAKNNGARAGWHDENTGGLNIVTPSPN